MKRYDLSLFAWDRVIWNDKFMQVCVPEHHII